MADLSHLRRILVVEDEALILLDVEQTLAEAGAETVLSAVTTDDALAIIEAATLDAAVLDLHLGRDGWTYEIARRLQQKGVPFVFSSGSVEAADGFQDVPLVTKPFSADQLIGALMEVTSSRDIVAAQ